MPTEPDSISHDPEIQPCDVLVITTEPLPLPGCATTGAGLRAWSLGEALQQAGLRTAIAYPPPPENELPHEITVRSGLRAVPFRRHNLAPLVQRLAPATLVLQHWGIFAEVPDFPGPIACDLAGPHLLERHYWGDPNPAASRREKIAALRRADYVTCSGEFQRHYFLPYLMDAGFTAEELNDVAAIPFGTPPEDYLWPGFDTIVSATSQPSDSATGTNDIAFVYGGAFLAWQDPSKSISWLLDELDQAQRGTLYFHGNAHPVLDSSAGKFVELLQRLRSHPRVVLRPSMTMPDLLAEYRQRSVALDLMARNPERELAYTTRTLYYAAAGLPIIYNNYSELSDHIRRHGAGWTLNPDNEAEFRHAIRSILSGTADLGPLRSGALQLAAAHDWTKTTQPLIDFCRKPVRRDTTASVLRESVEQFELEQARQERDSAISRLAQNEGQLIVRVSRHARKLRRPLDALRGLLYARRLRKAFRKHAP